MNLTDLVQRLTRKLPKNYTLVVEFKKMEIEIFLRDPKGQIRMFGPDDDCDEDLTPCFDRALRWAKQDSEKVALEGDVNAEILSSVSGISSNAAGV